MEPRSRRAGGRPHPFGGLGRAQAQVVDQDDDRPGRQNQSQQQSPSQREPKRDDDKSIDRQSDDDNESLPEGANDRDAMKQKTSQGGERFGKDDQETPSFDEDSQR